MGRAARVGAAAGQPAQARSAAALEALRTCWGRTHRLVLDDDRDWWACRRDGRGGRVTAGCPAGVHARLASERGFVPPLGRAGGSGHARR